MRIPLYRTTRRRWFAIYPVYLHNDDEWVWLEWVEQRCSRAGLFKWKRYYYELQ